MSQLTRRTAFLPLLALLLAGCTTAPPPQPAGAGAPGAAAPARPASFAEAVRQKADVTIVVTDSGLGGLSVAADLAARLPASGIARSARVVFVNALLDDRIGYNDLKREADKVRVFDAALAAMEERYHPDLILIACNTLSVVYGGTEHARTAPTKAVGIVGLGADLIGRQLDATPGASTVIFATRTTVESGAHRQLLVQKGYAGDRIVGEPCHGLAGSIERGALSDETRSSILRFVKDALTRLPPGGGPIVASLNCTHYGYAGPLWTEAFAQLGHPGVKVLDPNPLMADVVLRDGGPRRFGRTAVTVEVVSKVPITPDIKASLGPLLRSVSPATADALDAYRLEPRLFDVAIEPSALR